MIKSFNKFLRAIHYVCDFEYWWVYPGDPGYAEYQKQYAKHFGEKPACEPLLDSWHATYRTLWRCKQCGKIEPETKTAFL